MINRREFHLGLIGAYTTLALAQTEPRPAVRRRVALLIGNGRYSSGGVLKNPPNDAQDVAAALKRCHFDVTCKTDLSLDEFNDAVDGFVKSLKEGDVALFYYAGHGLQVGGANYLIPVDFDPSHGEAKVSQDCIGISELQARIELPRPYMNILLIDACRDNFFHPKSKIKGFAMMEAGLGTCMALSACPGQTASDQSKDRNSLFAQHLLKELSGPPAPIDQVFKQVKEKVYSASKQAQRPWVFLDTIGDFVFADADAPQTAQSLQIEALIEKGKSEYRAGKFQEAAATLETAYRVDRDNPYLCNALGAARSRINQKSIAVSLFSQAIEKKPDYAAAYFNRGAVLSTVSDRERDAIQDFTWAIEQEPSDARAYDLRGNCYVSISELDLALADFNQALTSNPADAEALLGRGRVSVRRRDNAGAIQDLTESLALKKTYQAYLVRSQAYVAANKANEAAADRKQAELLGPK